MGFYYRLLNKTELTNALKWTATILQVWCDQIYFAVSRAFCFFVIIQVTGSHLNAELHWMKFLHRNIITLPLDWILNRRKYFPKWLIFDQIIPFCSASKCTVFPLYPLNLETNFHWAKLPHIICFSLHILSFRWLWKLPFWAVLIANK